MKIIVIILSLLLIPSALFAGTTYYIDYDGGADTNDGITKETPWKHAPGMQGCSDNCATYESTCTETRAECGAGNKFILKGGVVWPNAALPWEWLWGSGTDGTEIEFGGLDETWYDSTACGNKGYPGYCRPVLDAEDQEVTGGTYQNAMFSLIGYRHIIDNIEFTGNQQTYGTDSSENGCNGEAGNGYGISMITVEDENIVRNNYIHGWSHAAVEDGGACTCWSVEHNPCYVWSGGTDEGKFVADNSIFISHSSGDGLIDLDSQCYNNVIDGSDTTGDMGEAIHGQWGHVYNNYISYVQNGTISVKSGYWWGNTFYNIAYDVEDIDVSQHHQSIEIYGRVIIYNNYINKSAGGATFITYGESGKDDYVFNNVVTNGQDQVMQPADGDNLYAFNNTLHTAATSGGAYIFPGPGGDTADYVYNNHLITGTGNFLGLNLSGTLTPNVEQNHAEAAGDYSGTTYLPKSDSAGVDNGLDLSAVCSGIPSSSPSLASTDCLKDTTLGVSYNTTTHTVSYPAKEAITRSDWDIGAYEYTPPTGASQLGITDSGISHGNGGS